MVPWSRINVSEISRKLSCGGNETPQIAGPCDYHTVYPRMRIGACRGSSLRCGNLHIQKTEVLCAKCLIDAMRL